MTTVTGTVQLPSGKYPPVAKVRFKLVKWATISGAIVPPDDVEASVDSGGSFSADVLPATYRVSVISDVQGVERETVLSKAAVVPSAPSVLLTSIL